MADGVGKQPETTAMTDQLNSRVTTVERNVDALRETSAHMQASLSSLTTESSAHTRDLHDIKEALTNQQSSSRTDWGVIALFGSLGVLISALAFTPVYRDLMKTEDKIEAYQIQALANAHQHGVSDAQRQQQAEEIEYLRKQVDTLKGN